MGFFGGLSKKPGDPLAALGGYDQNAAMQGQSGFAPMNAGVPAKKPGFFGRGSGLWDVLGTLGDTFSEGEPLYTQNKMHERNLMQRQQQAEQQRQQEREDFVWKSEYERANPKPVNNDTVNDLNWYKNLTEDDRKLYHQMKPVVGYMADGTPRVINPMEISQPNRSPAPGVVEDGFEFIGGDPANPKSWRPVSGGPVHNVPGGFR